MLWALRQVANWVERVASATGLIVPLFFLLWCTCFDVKALDLHFQQFDSVQFPASESVLQYQLIDVTGDSLDELIVLFHHSYHIYSPKTHTLLYSDTAESGIAFNAICVGDIGSDGQLDLVLVDKARQIWMRSPVLSLIRSVVDTAEWTGIGGTGRTSAVIDDFDSDGAPELSIARLAFSDPGNLPPEMDEYFSGIVQMIDPSNWSTKWYRNSPSTFWPQEFASAENQLSVDLNGDGNSEVVVWGDCWLNTITRVNESWERTWRNWSEMGVLKGDGNPLFEIRYPGPDVKWVLAGNFDKSSQAGELIAVVSEKILDPETFTVHTEWSLRGIDGEGDVIAVKWKTIVGDSAIGAVLKVSFPDESVLALSESHWNFYSGLDGQLMGYADGLEAAETREGHFSGETESSLELVQVSGNNAKFYRSEISTGFSDRPVLTPAAFELHQNYPNPFNPETAIGFSLDSKGAVSIDIYNVLGRKVRNLMSATLSSGDHVIFWDGRDDSGKDAASGVYFYRLKADSQARTRKMVLIR